jgi:hypothetical protein
MRMPVRIGAKNTPSAGNVLRIKHRHKMQVIGHFGAWATCLPVIIVRDPKVKHVSRHRRESLTRIRRHNAARTLEKRLGLRGWWAGTHEPRLYT